MSTSQIDDCPRRKISLAKPKLRVISEEEAQAFEDAAADELSELAKTAPSEPDPVSSVEDEEPEPKTFKPCIKLCVICGKKMSELYNPTDRCFYHNEAKSEKESRGLPSPRRKADVIHSKEARTRQSQKTKLRRAAEKQS